MFLKNEVQSETDRATDPHVTRRSAQERFVPPAGSTRVDASRGGQPLGPPSFTLNPNAAEFVPGVEYNYDYDERQRYAGAPPPHGNFDERQRPAEPGDLASSPDAVTPVADPDPVVQKFSPARPMPSLSDDDETFERAGHRPTPSLSDAVREYLHVCATAHHEQPKVQMESPTKLAGERPSLHFEMTELALKQLYEIIDQSVSAMRASDPAATSGPVIITLVRGAPCVEMMNLAQFHDWQLTMGSLGWSRHGKGHHFPVHVDAWLNEAGTRTCTTFNNIAPGAAARLQMILDENLELACACELHWDYIPVPKPLPHAARRTTTSSTPQALTRAAAGRADSGRTSHVRRPQVSKLYMPLTPFAR